jgi:redox-sensitive bicupin YhaK (pirin superfamily)
LATPRCRNRRVRDDQLHPHALGFQVWIDHAAKDRHVAPAGTCVAAASVPMIRAPGVTKRVLLGTSGQVASPLAVPTPGRLIDVAMAAGAGTDEDLNRAENAFVWVRSGQIRIGTVV